MPDLSAKFDEILKFSRVFISKFHSKFFTRSFKFKAQRLLAVKAKFKFKLYCGARAEFSLRGILKFIRARIS